MTKILTCSAALALIVAALPASTSARAGDAHARTAIIVVHPDPYGWGGRFGYIDPAWSWSGYWPVAAAAAYNARDFGWGWANGGYGSSYNTYGPCIYERQVHHRHVRACQ
jgi:hypothetical protein